MTLENRVEALEHELKILKNEIQSVLLEIREQMLNGYYPELRGEDSSGRRPAAAPAGSTAATHRNGYNHTPVNGARSVTIADDEPAGPVDPHPFSDALLQDILDQTDLDADDDFDSRPYTPPARHERHPHTPPPTPKPRAVKNRTESAKPHVNGTGPAAGVNGTGPKPTPAAPSNPQPNFAALANWVAESVAKIGKERTIQVVETYLASGGNLSEKTRSALMQLVTLANDERNLQPATNQDMLALLVRLDGIVNA